MPKEVRNIEINCPEGRAYSVLLDGKDITKDICGVDLSLRWDSVPEITLYFRAYPLKVKGKFRIKMDLEEQA